MLLLSIEHAQTIRTSKAQKNLRTVGAVDSDQCVERKLVMLVTRQIVAMLVC
jgi:hypothetical protein